MFFLPISMPRYKSIFLYQTSPKIKSFFQKKNAKFLNVGALRIFGYFANFWLRTRVIELLSGSKYNTVFDISNLRCAYVNTKIKTTSPLN